MVFEGAGTEAGLEIWRIEDFAPVPYPVNEYGKFYTGDSYILLHTKDNGGKLSWSLHFWLGNQTSQDESGSAAMLSVELDDQLGGVPTQFRETEGHESAKFLAYFPKGVRYLEGGVKSGFNHYDPDEVERRMFMVKGKRSVRVTQVDVALSSMNRSDCFILDCGKGKSILVYMPPGSRKMEKFKAIQVANEIRDEDHAGNSEVVVVDEFSDNYSEFFGELGEGSADEVPQEAQEDDDESSDASLKSQIKLFVLRDGSFEEVAQHPLNQDMLDNTDVFLLVSGGREAFVWVGKEASKEEKLAAMKSGQEFIEADTDRKKGTQLVRVLEGLETALFKQFFSAWNETEEKGAYTPSRIAEWKIDDLHTQNRRRVERAAGAAPGFLPDDGTGEKTIWRVEDMELVPLETEGFLFGGDSYVILYKYDGGAIVYFWQGSKSSTDERAASAIHAARIDNEELGGLAVQVRVVQGQEPRHFLRMFGGSLVIFSGGKASGFKNVNDRDEYDEDGTRLFRVRCLSSDRRDCRAEQVAETASSLASDDVFVLETKANCWIWKGKESSADEVEAAKGLMEIVCPGREFQEVAEGEEEAGLWEGLGGGGPGDINAADKDIPILLPRLFHVRQMVSGRSRAIEIFDFEKEDLVSDDVMILDTGREIIVWVGTDATSEERSVSVKMAEQYLDADPSPRDSSNTVILQVKEGAETSHFNSFF